MNLSNRIGHYSHVVQKERESIAILLKDEGLALPDDLDYFTYFRLWRQQLILTRLHALSTEEKQLLTKFRPSTLGAAKRIQGITPVAVLELIRHTRKMKSVTRTGSGEHLERDEIMDI